MTRQLSKLDSVNRALNLALVLISYAATQPMSTAAANPQVEAWEIKQQTTNLGPMTVLVSPDAIKLVAQQGTVIVTARKPSWKVVGLNTSENLGLEEPLANWPHDGLRMFKGESEILTGVKTVYFDPQLKMNILQREIVAHGRFYGSNDPAIFRSTEKKELKSAQFRCGINIPLDEQQKKVVQGIYSVPFAGGFPLELSNTTTDGVKTYIYKTISIARKKVDASTFNYPTGYKIAKDKLEVYMTRRQKSNFEDFLDAITDDPGLRGKKSAK